MSSVYLITTFIIFLIAIYLGVCVYKNVRRVTKQEVPLKFLLVNSFLVGTAGTLLFLSMIMFMGILEKAYTWTIAKIYGAAIISLIPGGIIAIGSFVQSIMITKYRTILLDALKRKGRDK